jgi:hypothetical protein
MLPSSLSLFYHFRFWRKVPKGDVASAGAPTGSLPVRRDVFGLADEEID